MNHQHDKKLLRGLRKADSLDSITTSSEKKENDLLKYRDPRTGSSMLHIAAYYGNLTLMEDLLSRCDLNPLETNRDKWSSFHYLSRFHQPLNQKLNIGLKVRDTKSEGGHSARFKFKYKLPPTMTKTTAK